MASYRVRVAGSEAAANGDVHLDCFIQRLNGATWEDVYLGHRTMELGAAAVLAITGGAGTDAQKRAALLALFIYLGVHQARENRHARHESDRHST